MIGTAASSPALVTSLLVSIIYYVNLLLWLVCEAGICCLLIVRRVVVFPGKKNFSETFRKFAGQFHQFCFLNQIKEQFTTFTLRRQSPIVLFDHIKNPDATFDSCLSFDKYVNIISRACILAHSWITPCPYRHKPRTESQGLLLSSSLIDCCHGLLACMSEVNLDKQLPVPNILVYHALSLDCVGVTTLRQL